MARILVSGSDFSPVIRVITWLLVVFSALAVIGRSATKLLFLHKLTDADDYFIVGSFVRLLFFKTLLYLPTVPH